VLVNPRRFLGSDAANPLQDFDVGCSDAWLVSELGKASQSADDLDDLATLLT
jgi:hypothetical protein